MRKIIAFLLSVCMISGAMTCIHAENTEILQENKSIYIFSERFADYGVSENTNFRDYPTDNESNVNGGFGFSGKWSSEFNTISDFSDIWPKISPQQDGSGYGCNGVMAYRQLKHTVDFSKDGVYYLSFSMSANRSDELSGVILGNNDLKIGCKYDGNSNIAVFSVGENEYISEINIENRERYTYVLKIENKKEAVDTLSLKVYSDVEEAELFPQSFDLVSECELGTSALESIALDFFATPTYITEVSMYTEFDSTYDYLILDNIEELLKRLPEDMDYTLKDEYSTELESLTFYINYLKENGNESVLDEIPGYTKYLYSVMDSSVAQIKVDLDDLFNATIYASTDNIYDSANPNVITGPNYGFEIDSFKEKSEWKYEWADTDTHNIYCLEDTEYRMKVKDGYLQYCAYRSMNYDRAVDIIDIKNANYNEIDILVNHDNLYFSLNGGYSGIVLVYEDGTRTLCKNQNYDGGTDRSAYQNQISGNRIAASDRTVEGTLYIHELKIPVDRNKVLDKIEILNSFAKLNAEGTDVDGFEQGADTEQIYRATYYAITLKQTVSSLKDEVSDKIKGHLNVLPSEGVTEDDAIYYAKDICEIDSLISYYSEVLLKNYETFHNYDVYLELKSISEYINGKTARFYVSQSGDDKNSGSETDPIKTPKEALNRAKAVKKIYPDFPVEVIIGKGVYLIDETLNFNNEISATETAPVVFEAKEGERPVFTGSVTLDKSKFMKVTDDSILQRLPQSSKDKVLVFDLESEGIIPYEYQVVGQYGGIGSKHSTLYSDGEEQMLARWPNTGFANVLGYYGTKTVIIDSDKVVSLSTAPYAVFNCFFSFVYSFDRWNVASVNQSISSVTLNASTDFNASAGGRYYISNLIEELDIPGEYYIENNLLYYYPYENFDETELTLSNVTNTLISIDDAQYIRFEGITFNETCADVIDINNSSQILIEECDFNNIGMYSVNANNVSDVCVRSCDFYNLGNTGVSLSGGNFQTLQASNNEVSNCIFNKFSQFRRCYAPAVSINGVGGIVRNNVIHNSPHEAIAFDGNDHKIIYNEIYDVCLETSDCGAIYGGRNLYKRGVEVAYNYIHNSKSLYTADNAQRGIYFDDGLSGGSVHDNVIVNTQDGIFVHGGSDMQIYNNILVDCEQRGVGISYTGNSIAQLMADAKAQADTYPIYYEKYPQMYNIYARGDQHPRGNVVKDNVLVNSIVETTINVELGNDLTTQNIVENNITATKYDFIDPEKHDYNIKKDSEILKQIPELADFDFSKIGVQGRDELQLGRFNKHDIYTDGQKTVFSWTESENADYYRIIISTDPEFNNIIEDAKVYNNIFELPTE